jgi:transposase
VRLSRNVDNEAERTESCAGNGSVLESVPGIGAITALNLLLRLPELGTINRRRKRRPLVGVAPYANPEEYHRRQPC